MTDAIDTRTQILTAAFESFAERGYDKTSMDDIVRRSGLSKGSLYWHFKNKHDLLLAVMDMVMKDLKLIMERMTDPNQSAGDRLRQGFIETAEAFTTNPTFSGLLVNFFFQASQSPEARTIMQDAYEVYVTLIAGIIRDGIANHEFRDVDARQTAIMLIGAGDGIVFQLLLDPPWNIAELMNMLFDVFLRGLRKDPEKS